MPQSYFDKIDSLSKIWSVPFRNICLALLNEKERVLVHTHLPKSQLSLEMQDIRRWALNRNRNNFLEHPDDFVVPDFLSIENDSTDLSPLFASTTEGDCFSVILFNKTVLMFDSSKKSNKSPLHRRHLVTDEYYEPNHTPKDTQITASCFILDNFLLLATNDGVLRARPRCNPKSVYYVENFNSIIHQMTSLYNVVTLIHSYHILEVRFASQKEEDPFSQLALVYKATNVDCEHPPLLYGPYVIYKSLDQSWYRVLYESSNTRKEVVQILGHAGWNILSIKNANWRFLTIVAEGAKTKRREEFFLFSDF